MDNTDQPTPEEIAQESESGKQATSVIEPPAPDAGVEQISWRKLFGPLGAVALLLFKFKGVILIALSKLKLLLIPLKYLKFGKVFTTLGSMLATVVIDATRWGWAFAVGFVLLLFVHEMGHALMLRARGIKAGVPVFIPFMGAFIGLKEMPKDAKTEAEVGIAGPLLGTLGAVLCLQLGGPGRMELFTRLAYVGFLINLFNLLPVLPLDGGRVMAAISPKVWVIGLILTVVAFFWSHNPIFLIIVLMSAGRMWHAFKVPPEELDYYKVPRSTRLQMTAAYFGLALFLAAMMMQLHHK